MGISTIIKLSISGLPSWTEAGQRELPGKSINAPLGGKSAVASCRFNRYNQTMQAEEKRAHISCSDCHYSHIDTLLTNRCGATDHKFFTLLLTGNQFVKPVFQPGRKNALLRNPQPKINKTVDNLSLSRFSGKTRSLQSD